jgi:hypothetical protein
MIANLGTSTLSFLAKRRSVLLGFFAAPAAAAATHGTDKWKRIRTASALAHEAGSRDAIRNGLYLYARGIDRRDEAMLRSAFWPEAKIEVNDAEIPVEKFLQGTMASLRTDWDRVMHFLTNILIQFDGVSAAVETYNYAYHCALKDGKKRDVVIAGRYLDHFEARDDEWRIVRRTVVVDWFRAYPDSGDMAEGPLGMKFLGGRSGPDDRSYALFGGPSP